MMRAPWLALLLCLAGPCTALAFPDGTPWSVAATADCASCHFGAAPIEPAPGLHLQMPAPLRAGETYRLKLGLDVAGMRRAGFRLIAASAEGAVGAFKSVDDRIQLRDGILRVTEVGKTLTEPGFARWEFLWTTPDPWVTPIEFKIDAVAANDDASSLGDVVHRRKYSLAPGSR